MTRIILEIERRPLPHVTFEVPADVDGHVATEDAIAAATTAAAKSLGAPLVVVFTKSGFSARIIASHRPGVPILVLTDQRAHVPAARARVGRDPRARAARDDATRRCSSTRAP